MLDELTEAKVKKNYELLQTKYIDAVKANKGANVNKEIELRLKKYETSDVVRGAITSSDFTRTRESFIRYVSGNSDWSGQVAPDAPPRRDLVTEMTQNYLKIHEGKTDTILLKEKLPDPEDTKQIGGIDFKDYPIRIGMAIEITRPDTPSNVTPTTQSRERERYSYQKNRGVERLLKVDFTHTTFRTNSVISHKEYSIEIEALSTTMEFFDLLPEMLEVAGVLLKILNQTNILYTREERGDLIQSVNKLFLGSERVQKTSNISRVNIMRSELNKPIDMSHRDLETGNPEGMFPSLKGLGAAKGEAQYSVTVKLDGVRTLIYYDDDKTWLFSPISQVVNLLSRDSPERLQQTLLDAEMLVDGAVFEKQVYRLFLFDCLIFTDQDIRRMPHANRLRFCRAAMHISNADPDLNTKLQMAVKIFYPFSTREEFFKANRLALSSGTVSAMQYEFGKDIKEEELETDGLIFTHTGEYLPRSKYQNDPRSKNRRWKPQSQLTLDFLIELAERGTLVPKVFSSKAGTEDNLVTFEGTRGNPFDPSAIVMINNEMIPPLKVQAGQIAEFQWDRAKRVFRPIRIRHDKLQPNNIEVAISNWDLIRDPIPPGMLVNALKGQRVLQFLRRYTNRVKASLINNLSTTLQTRTGKKVTCLDIGAGEGGDVGKFKIADMEVIAIEPSSQRVRALEERIVAENMTDNYTIFEAGAQNFQGILRKFERLNRAKVDCVTMFHSLTFFYDSEATVNSLINTIKGVIRPGGRFVCMAMDGQLLDRELGDSAQVAMPGISIQRVRDDTNRKIRVKLIAKDDSLLRGQEEYLVDFNHFIMNLEANGFELIGDRYLGGDLVLNDSEMWWAQMTRVIQMRFVGVVDEPPKDLFNKLRTLMNEAFKITATLAPNTKQQFPIGSIQFGVWDLWTIGCIGGGSCFLHSILHAISAEYRAMTLDARITMVKALRVDLAQVFTQDTWASLASGNLAGLGAESGTYSYEVMRKGLMDYSHWFGLEFLEFVSNQLGINIHIVWWVKGSLQVYLHGEAVTGSARVFQEDRDNVILYWQGGMHFQIVGREPEGSTNGSKLDLIFASNDKMIQQIRDEVPKDN